LCVRPGPREPEGMGTDAWLPAPGYLNASTLGLPPRRTVEALRTALDRWQAGEASAVEYDVDVLTARGLYAGLVGVPTTWVAVGSQVSVMVAEVAAAMPDGALALGVEGDFTSVTGPFEAQARRGVRVEVVPLDRLAEGVLARRPQVVAFSLAQSADGRLADADAVEAAAREVGALTVCDTTQAAGWLEVDAGRWDVTVCSAYKWLCAPRGSAFLTVRPEAMGRLAGHNRGWYAGEDVWASVYGLGLRPASDARRFDVSPVWLAWVGARTSLEVLLDLPAEVRRRHGADLADELRSRLGQEPAGRPVVCLPDPDGSLLPRLAEAGVTAVSRAGRARLAFHLWNDGTDVDRVVTALSAAGSRPLAPA
jgi:selenocysteine lyase/cysteine desulfurase